MIEDYLINETELTLGFSDIQKRYSLLKMMLFQNIIYLVYLSLI